MIDPTNLLASPQNNRVEDAESDRTNLDRDAFMQLLVTQLENQDPLDPVDSREMITQLSELSSVEYLMGIEDKLGGLELSSMGDANNQAAALVGKEVTVDGSTLALGELGDASASFTLASPAAGVTVSVRNAAGQVVEVVELGARSPGPQQFRWDGNDSTGTRSPAGTYRITVAAVDAERTPVAVSTDVRGTVDAVRYENGAPELEIGGTQARLGDVLSVRNGEGASP